MDFEKSKVLLEEAKSIIPLASQTYSKSYRYFTGLEAPHFIERGEGAYVWDIDGNKFIDFICALGPITVGYNNSEINDAIITQMKKGIIFSKASPMEIELARLLKKKMPFIEMVRYMKNGSDVTTTAVRLARAYTRRDIVLVCGYHGIHDWYIGTTVNKLGIPSSVCELTKTFSYNNIEDLRKVLSENTKKVAAVIMEPIQGDGPNDGYLEAVRKLTEEEDIVLIFDEIVSGFRYAAGGASELYNIEPDLITFGKGMANGMPLSVVAGKKCLLEMIETDNVFISTTFGGETLSLAAAIKTIQILDRVNGYKHMWEMGEIYLENTKKLIKKYKLEEIVSTYGLPPHCGVNFMNYSHYSYLDFQSIYLKVLLDNNILSIGINNFNISHTRKEVQKLNNAMEKALKVIREKLDNNESMVEKSLMIDPVFKR